MIRRLALILMGLGAAPARSEEERSPISSCSWLSHGSSHGLRRWKRSNPMKTVNTANRRTPGLAPEGVVAQRGGQQDQAQRYGRSVQQIWISALSGVVCLLALAATSTGIFTSFGQHHRNFLSLRGQMVSLQGGGLYANELVSGATQAIGQDIVTLLVAIPLLLIATYLVARGSLRGRLLQAGALWYFAYTYLLMAFGAAYNPFFLIYVALYSVSLLVFLLSLLSIDAGGLAGPSYHAGSPAERSAGSSSVSVRCSRSSGWAASCRRWRPARHPLALRVTARSLSRQAI